MSVWRPYQYWLATIPAVLLMAIIIYAVVQLLQSR